MKKILLLSLLSILSVYNVVAQTAYNPFTQNIHFAPEPTAAGFECNTTQTVVFTQGLTTLADATQWQTSPMKVVICVSGFTFTGSASSVVSGPYASNFDWAYDVMAPNCIIGTQNQTLHGTGSNPGIPDPLSSGDIQLQLTIPETSPIGTILSVNVSLQIPSYMQTYNSVPDDNEITQTQTYCPLKIHGNVYNDRNNDADVNGNSIYNPDSTQLYAHLVDSNGLVVDVVSVDVSGHFEFQNVTPFANYTVVLGITQGAIGGTPPSADLPGTWIHTGEDCCDKIGNDATPDGINAVSVSNFTVKNVDFGIKDPNAFNVPLTLKHFFVSEYKCHGLLSWITSFEENTSHVDIYRKSGSDNVFSKIATVQSAGSSHQEKAYSYSDEAVNSGEVYEYYLQFIDIDGQFTISEIRSLTLDCESESNSLQIFPNPATSELSVLYVTIAEEAVLNLDISDIAGRKLYTKSSVLKPGANLINFDIIGLAAGTYLIHYTDEESLTKGTFKFVKQ
ncbi:MAG: T9SS type A sorting domain-containing protein [Bacteroidetes bacterium]|nr:T9SS type A sorting domain-containing protein [Bacteroidota bacterium]